MKFKKVMAVLTLCSISLIWASLAYAHTPICSCYLNGDGTVTCEGGFSDGSSAAGVKMTVQDKDGKVLIEDKMDEDSEFSFDMPEGNYDVVFDAGPGHVVLVKGEDITE